MARKKLWKSTIVIWSESNPQEMELSDLAREAECGDAYASKQEAVFVDDPGSDKDWDGTEFFDTPGDDDEEDEADVEGTGCGRCDVESL